MPKTLLRAVDETMSGTSEKFDSLRSIRSSMQRAIFDSDWDALIRLDRVCMGLVRQTHATSSSLVLQELIEVRSLYKNMIGNLHLQLQRNGELEKGMHN
ncbi:hypothetical protein NBRC116493_19670 [Aurantivibrio infirmus]